MASAEEQEVESRYLRLMLTSMLKAIDALHADVDVSESVRRHMLGICDGVRQRAIAAAEEGDQASATANVDSLIAMIEESFAYSALPQFGDIKLLKLD